MSVKPWASYLVAVLATIAVVRRPIPARQLPQHRVQPLASLHCRDHGGRMARRPLVRPLRHAGESDHQHHLRHGSRRRSTYDGKRMGANRPVCRDRHYHKRVQRVATSAAAEGRSRRSRDRSTPDGARNRSHRSQKGRKPGTSSGSPSSTRPVGRSP